MLYNAGGGCLLSIIIPCYNVEKYLDDCLTSILSQEITFPIEVIAVDDGSTDGTPVILQEYSKRHSNLKVITQENQGVSAARNAGIMECTGEYIWFIDSDDYIKPKALQAIFEVVDFSTMPGIVVFTNANSVNEHSRFVDETVCEIKDFEKKESGAGVGTASVWCMIYKNNPDKSLRVLFDTNMSYAEDTLFAYEICRRIPYGNIWFLIHDQVYCYRNRPGSAMSTKSIETRTKHVKSLFYLGEVFQSMIKNEEVVNELKLKHLYNNQVKVISEGLLLLPATSLKLKEVLKELKEKKLYPIPFQAKKIKARKSFKGKVIGFIEMGFKFELWYRIYYFFAKKFFNRKRKKQNK